MLARSQAAIMVTEKVECYLLRSQRGFRNFAHEPCAHAIGEKTAFIRKTFLKVLKHAALEFEVKTTF